MMIKSDMHIHTDLSRCCRSPEQTLGNIIDVSTKKGLEKIGLTDHVWMNPAVTPSDFYKHMDGSGILDLHKVVHSGQWDIDILFGCEAETRAPGVFGITREFKERLDFVGMLASHFHMSNFIEQPVKKTPRGIADHLIEFFISAVSSGFPDIIVHPLFPFGFGNLYEAAIATLSDGELSDALGIAAEKNIGIEINPCSFPNPKRDRVFELETPVRVFELAKRAGCKFTFGSDAHAPGELDNLEKLRYFVDVLELTESDLHPLAKQINPNI